MDGHIVSQSGTTLGRRYRVERVIGNGGMGIVYEVTHLNTGQRLALRPFRRVPLRAPIPSGVSSKKLG